jgi:hypothetical protein
LLEAAAAVVDQAEAAALVVLEQTFQELLLVQILLLKQPLS